MITIKNVGKGVAKNNNATIVPDKGALKSKPKVVENTNQVKRKATTKVIPIIQTRGMKAKLTNQTNVSETEYLNNIDSLTADEFLAGEIDYDGVELTIGSDLDEFLDDAVGEPGEVSSSGEEESPLQRQTVSSKVIKPNKNPQRSDKFSQFAHLKNDPEFRQFVSELVVDAKTATNAAEGAEHGHIPRESSKVKHKKGNNFTFNSSQNDFDSDIPLTDLAGNTERQNHVVCSRPNFKSPSDTTIYSPGLQKISGHSSQINDIALIDKISNFVEGIRLDSKSADRSSTHKHRSIVTPPYATGDGSDQESAVRGLGPGVKKDCRHVEDHHRHKQYSAKQHQRDVTDDGEDDDNSDWVADRLLIQAEKFRAHIEAPKGNYNQLLMPYDYDKLRSKFVKPEGLGPIDSEILCLRNFDRMMNFSM